MVKIFLTMLAKKDQDHVVRASAFTIGEWAKKSEAETIECLKVLMSPDTKRIEPQPFDGRRVEKVAGGYLILNGEHYHNMMQEAGRKAYRAEWMRNHRAKEKGSKVNGRSKPLPGENEFCQMERNGEDTSMEPGNKIPL